MQELIAISHSMQEIKRVSVLMKNTRIHTLIVGDIGVGKSRLAEEIAPKAYKIAAAKFHALQDAIMQFDEIIIENFDQIANFDWNLQGKRIVATSRFRPRDAICDKLFGLTLEILPLKNRPEDITPLMEKFMQSAAKELNLEPVPVKFITPDLSQNCHSLKRCVYAELIRQNQTEDEFIYTMKSFFDKKVDQIDNYHVLLELFDKAAILSNQDRYKSQLMMAKMMGINRNTLRKKMSQLGLDG